MIISLSNVRRRLFDSQLDLAERGKEAIGQVRYNEDELPEESQKSILRHSSDQGRADETHLRNPGNSIADDGTADRADDEISGHNRGTQGEQSDALGADDKQHQTFGRGNSSQRTYICITKRGAVGNFYCSLSFLTGF